MPLDDSQNNTSSKLLELLVNALIVHEKEMDRLIRVLQARKDELSMRAQKLISKMERISEKTQNIENKTAELKELFKSA